MSLSSFFSELQVMQFTQTRLQLKELKKKKKKNQFQNKWEIAKLLVPKKIYSLKVKRNPKHWIKRNGQ